MSTCMKECTGPVDNGVYRTGLASAQEVYDAAVNLLFESLGRLEAHLKDRGSPYLLGYHITEADVRFHPTIAQFDVAYHPVFLCSRLDTTTKYPALYLWLRRLYWDKTGTVPWCLLQNYAAAHAQVWAPYASVRQMVVFLSQNP